jgi:hypothetical protein
MPGSETWGRHFSSLQVEEHMTFWIDDAAKTFIFSDGQRLRIRRFDKSWISASSEDEFNRADRCRLYAYLRRVDNLTRLPSARGGKK